MSHGCPHVPAHLRRFVVPQNYGAYNAADQAVWRFVLLQMQARLIDTAHPAYRNGLATTGISVDRIPSVEEMNDRLARFGWGAVCVDGFIPPRAFQEFQAASILPIAADIRTREHLVYTPAPDIIHEAAGHAPILPDPGFASYLRRIGELGRMAFAHPQDDRVYQTIHALSELKERPTATGREVADAEGELAAALAEAREPSEAARLSRLYWWTAEYGLVGRVDNYKIYGAGLLSSLGESHFCHDPGVRKLPLDEHCIEVAYDITRPQPQLFVAQSFEALHDVLDRVARTLAVTRGGGAALAHALRSRELASVRFTSGATVMGVLTHVGPGLEDPAWLEFDGPVAFAWDDALAPANGQPSDPTAYCVLTGPLEGGVRLDRASDEEIDRWAAGPARQHRFCFASGARVEGRLQRVARDASGRLTHLEIEQTEIALPGRAPLRRARYMLLAAGDVVTAQAGAVDPHYHGDTAFPEPNPSGRALPEGERALVALYDQVDRLPRVGRPAAPDVVECVRRVHAILQRDFPGEWLLRWNLLEALLRAGEHGETARALTSELERLEVRYDHREPIASGLRYLACIAA